jgi:hypothetical protein
MGDTPPSDHTHRAGHATVEGSVALSEDCHLVPRGSMFAEQEIGTDQKRSFAPE